MTFYQQVYQVVARIPAGSVLGYGHIAWMLGAPKAARQVGWAMRRCPVGLPWHRVIRSDGSIAVGMHPDLQRSLLESEGVTFLPDGRVDMERHRWLPETKESLT